MSWLQPLLDWVGSHPNAALAVIAALCFLDALFLIGFLFPSPVILFSVGALIALDRLQFWPAVVSAAAGGLVGDGFNYWLGRRYGERLFQARWAQRYRSAINAAQRFVDRYGGPSLIIGRFVGVVRPNVPMVAGAYRMPVAAFLAWATVAGLLWAAVYTLPGIAVGASLSLAAEVATRLAVLLVAVLALLWGIGVLTRIAVRYTSARAETWVVNVLDWSQRHRRLGRLGGWLTDPDQPETPALLVFALILLVGGWLALALLWGVARDHPLPFDALTYQSLSDLHAPWALLAAAWIAHLGDARVMVATGVSMIVMLGLLRQPRAAAHAGAALGFGLIIAYGLRAGVQLSDPLHYFQGGSRTRFSGGDLVLTTVVFGLLAVLLANGRRAARRARYYGIAGSLLALVAGSQLYLGVQWMSVAAFALVIGGAWVTVLAVGYLRHNPQKVPGRRFFIPMLLAYLTAVVLIPPKVLQLPDGESTPTARLTAEAWWSTDYAVAPAYRGDSAGRARQPLNVQWLGSIEQIRAALQASGWAEPPRLAASTALRFLAPSTPISELPVLPQVHAGRHQALVLTRTIDEEQEAVIRLWSTRIRVDAAPVWVGSLTLQRTRELLDLLQVPVTEAEFETPLHYLMPPPVGFAAQAVHHPRSQTDAQWRGTVLLLRPSR